MTYELVVYQISMDHNLEKCPLFFIRHVWSLTAISECHRQSEYESVIYVLKFELCKIL